MKQISRLFFIITIIIVLQSESVYAQLGVGAANVAAHGILAIAGGGREAKQEKIIEQSTKLQKIGGSNVTVLRVKEADIKSKAKSHIIALQNRLNQYYSLYKNNLPVDMPKNDEDLLAIQDMDENWPSEYYVSELRAYKKYTFQLKQKMAAAPVDSLNARPAAAVKKDSTK